LLNLRAKRVLKITIGGEEFAQQKVSTVASAHTRFQNHPLSGATHAKDTGKMIAEELISYIVKKSVVKTTRDDRIKVLAFE
jgi:hypothetical protein